MVAAKTYAGRRMAVMGLGRAGLAAVRAGLAGGATVIAWDDTVSPRAAAAQMGAEIVDLSNPAAFRDVAVMVLSPGVPLDRPAPHPAVVATRQAGTPVIGDAQLLAQQQPEAVYVGVTGTNGKSTTTALIAHILNKAGIKSAAGGNLGEPAIALPEMGVDGVYVLEMSSYQLELSPPKFHIALLLNITPDHLDRHGGMAGYKAAKEKIFADQQNSDLAIIGVDDDDCAALADKLRRQGRHVVPVSSRRAVPGGVYALNGRLLEGDIHGNAEPVLEMATAKTLPGAHNAQNIAAAWATARRLGVPAAVIRAAIADFPGLPHRQEVVAKAGGITFINDSKATNAEAAAKALSCYDAIYWIAGGMEKEGGYDALTPFLPAIRHAFLIGAGANNLARLLDGRIPATLSHTLQRAVADAFAAARHAGHDKAVILLSPACASFDQFENFEQRGDVFRRLAAGLAATTEGVGP